VEGGFFWRGSSGGRKGVPVQEMGVWKGGGDIVNIVLEEEKCLDGVGGQRDVNKNELFGGTEGNISLTCLR
jgi:hypothetical protein